MRRPGIQWLTMLGLLLGACAEAKVAPPEPLVVFTAVSLAAPLRAALDTFTQREGLPAAAQEVAGSVELARRVAELGRTPDLIVVADPEVLSRHLAPAHVDGWVLFARNRLVLAYTDRSRGADRLSTARWYEILTRDDVEVGRTDPDLVPIGYRTLLAWRLAERHHGRAGLEAQLLARSPPRNVRPESELVALLQAGELDYAWLYESQARAVGLRVLPLPVEIDLSDPALEQRYAEASIRLRGRTAADSITMAGAPIVYALAVPRAAPQRARAERAARFLVSDSGRAILARHGLNTMDSVRAVGSVAAWMRAP